MHLVTLGGTLVLLQDAADLPVHQLTIEASLGAGNAARQAFERKLDTLAKFVVHGTFFVAPIRRTTQHYGLAGFRVARELDLDILAHLAPTNGCRQRSGEFLQLRLRRADDVTPAGLLQPG